MEFYVTIFYMSDKNMNELVKLGREVTPARPVGLPHKPRKLKAA